MATLHVRNFPDALYEALRVCAEQHGRSIGAETVQLVAQSMGGEAARASLQTRRRRATRRPFQRFSRLGRSAVAAAQGEARALGHDHIGTEHLLLAILAGEGLGGRALRALGLTREGARERIEAERGRGDAPAAGELPFAPETKKAFELALRESLGMRHGAIGTEHLVLGIAAEADSLGARMLLEAEPSREALRGLVVRESAAVTIEQVGSFLPGDTAEFRVVELTGDAAAWEHALNDAAEEDFELVEIVDRRAIFRRG